MYTKEMKAKLLRTRDFTMYNLGSEKRVIILLVNGNKIKFVEERINCCHVYLTCYLFEEEQFVCGVKSGIKGDGNYYYKKLAPYVVEDKWIDLPERLREITLKEYYDK